jgi:hypothetical protein
MQLTGTFGARCRYQAGAFFGECDRDAASGAASGAANDGDFAG